jgi:hypothetical protein
MGLFGKKSIENPAQKEEDLEIKTPEELEKAKKMAGVVTEKEVLERAEEFGREIHDYKLAQEAKELKETRKEEKEIIRNVVFRKKTRSLTNPLTTYVAEQSYGGKSIVYGGLSELDTSQVYDVEITKEERDKVFVRIID